MLLAEQSFKALKADSREPVHCIVSNLLQITKSLSIYQRMR